MSAEREGVAWAVGLVMTEAAALGMQRLVLADGSSRQEVLVAALDVLVNDPELVSMLGARASQAGVMMSAVTANEALP